jgi:hypothetical protein
MNRIVRTCVAMFSIGLGTSGACAMASDDIALAVSSARLGGGDVALNVQLRYSGATPIAVYHSDLPWGIRDSLLLVAVCLDARKSLLPQVTYIDDPSPGQVQMRPGEALSGNVSLGRRFPALPECLKRSSALVFWSYELTPVGSREPLSRQTGGLLIDHE